MAALAGRLRALLRWRPALPAPLSRLAGLAAAPYRATARFLYRRMPKGLFARTLLIIVVPIAIMQAVLGFVFLERHYELVTRRLSEAVVRDVALLVDMLGTYPQEEDFDTFTRMARQDLDLSVAVLPLEPLPPPRPKPFFDILDRYLSEQIGKRIGRPFWIDTVGRSSFIEIRIRLDRNVLRVIARRNQAYASNSHIFIVWMLSTSLVLIVIALIFLRNQIRPVERLATAAESFGMGRPIDDFRPSGALEVRRAAQAFIEMRRRIERQMEQRTAMLAGVSHDLRTILTRFRLQLALFPDSDEVRALRHDVAEMNTMLADYLAFARGDGDEKAQVTDIALLFEELEAEAEILNAQVSSSFQGAPEVTLKPIAFKRCLTNLVSNAARHGSTVRIDGRHAEGWLTVTIEDDGPGIAEDERENVFRPFYRLDQARNQDAGGSGLGLAIARDIARAHGGDIVLDDSVDLGGLKVRVRIPV
ncbi:HAMP domain-containing protein [Stappia taiwanensis]|uniref:histidine kinase n=2 Tax=Stappia taiwanensis TaxID=992267 RepID=A0A838XW85_9HYPH|nr:HAMP domain-containing protein [Stappia taiwanensis]GGE86768.1 two-component sensor histidine kinase [Stappia taiwanensis]